MKVKGDKIRELRWGKQWSVRQLGALIGITRTQMTNIELGSQSTTSPRVNKLAKVLGCKRKDLLK